MVRPLSTPESELVDDEPIPVVLMEEPPMHLWVRGALIFITAGLILVFSIAVMLDPYKGGRVWYEATHTQLGLPSCTFKVVSQGIPCPSCGMTTSFSLLMHGDVWNSLKANFAGTLLAVLGLVFIPWALVSVYRGRPLGVGSLENLFVKLLVVFLILMIARWVVVLCFMLLG